MAHDITSLLKVFLPSLLLADVALVVPCYIAWDSSPGSGGAVTERAAPVTPPAAPPQAKPFCQDRFLGDPVSPRFVAITYLDSFIDDKVTAIDVRGWIADIPPSAIRVMELTEKSGVRRVAFELHSAWSEWNVIVAGTTGTGACERLHAALVKRGVGRPGPAPAGEDESRYRLESIYARRDKLYESRVEIGSLAEVFAANRLAEIIAWVDSREP